MTNILYLHVVGVSSTDESSVYARRMLNLLCETAAPETKVDLWALPSDRPRHVDYHSYEGLIIGDVVKMVRLAATKYDGIAIGCFYDLGLREAREISENSIVTAPCQAATDIAGHLGNNFSILVGSRKNVARMSENVRAYGRDHAMASIRPIGLSVWEQQESEYAFDRMLETGRKCIEEDGAEVLILGCTAGFGLHDRISAELNIPVIDAMLATFKYVEFLANAAKGLGWRPSRLGGSQPPPENEMEKWRLFDSCNPYKVEPVK